MGIGDAFNELTQKARDFARQHPDKVEEGLDKLGDLADQKTGGKYSGQIDKGEEIIKQRLDEQGPTGQGPTGQGPTGQGPTGQGPTEQGAAQ